MLVPIIVIMVLAVVLTHLVSLIERWVAPWQTEIAGDDGV
jgi:ABC-type nitrate/sulfonate/bicarbonate transport system permease component